MSADGFGVVLGCRRNEKDAAAVKSEIEGTGGAAEIVSGDVSSSVDTERLFAAADKIGPLHGLVNAAAEAGKPVEFLDLAADDAERIWRTNFLGAMNCCQLASKRMSLKHGGTGGKIVNITSQAASSGGDRRIPYAASKAALELLTVSLGSELAEHGILVTAVSPGLIDTEQLPDDGETRRKQIAKSVPLGRMGHADEVASTVSWLMSSGASYITGAIIPVNGGRRA